MKALGAIVRKDLKLFLNNPKAVIITMLVPIVIGTFMGALVGGGSSGKPRTQRVRVAVVNQDTGPISGSIVESLQKDASLKPEIVSEAEARDSVRNGRIGVAVIIPPDFGDQATRAMFRRTEKPRLSILHDPSKSMESSMVTGLLAQNIMQIIGQEAFSGAGGGKYIRESLEDLKMRPAVAVDPVLIEMLQGLDKFMNRPTVKEAGGTPGLGLENGFSIPYETVSEATSQRVEAQYNGYAHSFAGMAVQFVLMFSIETGIALLLERQRGLWARLRAAPLSKGTVLAGRAVSSAAISLLTLFVCWGFCMTFLGVRVHGSWVAFILCNVSFAFFAASVGLLLAAIGRSPEATKGLSMFAILILVMLGGAWVPSFIFPEWLQKVTLLVPTRWAVDGFDGATWRGLSFSATMIPAAVLLGYTLCLGALAMWRFKWEEA